MLNDTLRAAYLDYSNNYLTARVFGEHNGLTEEQARAVIDMGRALHESHCAMIKGESPSDYFVLIKGDLVTTRVFRAADMGAGQLAAQYLESMFPHLRGQVFVDPVINSQANRSLPCAGFVKDSAQAYLTTGNGFPRPVNLKLES